LWTVLRIFFCGVVLQKDIRRLRAPESKFTGLTAGYYLLDHRRLEIILGKLIIDQVRKKLAL
jgi:hypothetical protein